MAHAFPTGATRATRPAATQGLRPDATRVLAQAGVIVVHAAALMMLLTPARISLPEAPDREMTVLLPPTLHQPPPPVAVTPRVPDRVPVAPAPVPRQPAPIVAADETPFDLPALPETAAGDASPDMDAGPSIDSAPDLSPMTGASLAYADAPAPRYPPRAVREGRSGTVLLDITVGTDGKPLEVSIARSSGHRDLDQAALRQVLRHWRFQPAMRDGHAVVAIGRVPVDFKL
ncbi:energy transducer TonB [Marilutibacter spongiae]|uniref:TonB family protein n=1 Tax=Marilutibacter spongiae TaxID=2025720 RepID=A0A7W3Y6G3_9GAMM|nr:energy transducer TonB [Lysobacter spongiae]MBB1060990.1 TonB family protein [Lysobacter spongiae]